MRLIGYSSGAIVKGNFSSLIHSLPSEADAIEISALREHELEHGLGYAEYFLKTDTGSKFKHISFHAPNSLLYLTDIDLANKLLFELDESIKVVVHPYLIKDIDTWRKLGDRLLIENMDNRDKGNYCGSLQANFKGTNQLIELFDYLPKAKFCFDIGHAFQGGDQETTPKLLERFSHRLEEVHFSYVDGDGKHWQPNQAIIKHLLKYKDLIPKNATFIIESEVKEGEKWDSDIGNYHIKGLKKILKERG